jgi:hypothetical protein
VRLGLLVNKLASTSDRPATLWGALRGSAILRVDLGQCLNRVGIVGSGSVGSRGWCALWVGDSRGVSPLSLSPEFRELKTFAQGLGSLN